MSQCKTCHNNYTKDRYRRVKVPEVYGISYEDYKEMRERQGGRCAICGTPEDESVRQVLCIDHDHTTGTVRGLLCHNCNLVLGFCHDSAGILVQAASYILRG